ncbi:response regulator [Candidatus Saccharibacteria bacterium]|nr:response regulator [Candidatus Saccharibacteria bacterium]
MTEKSSSTPVKSAIRARVKNATIQTIFVIDDDELFASCIKSAVKKHNQNLVVKTFKNALDAMNALETPLPSLIFLDVLLPGADGFTFLNELSSYPDTAKIPVVLVTSLELPEADLSIYGIKGILDKATMKPEEVIAYAKRYTN